MYRDRRGFFRFLRNFHREMILKSHVHLAEIHTYMSYLNIIFASRVGPLKITIRQEFAKEAKEVSRPVRREPNLDKRYPVPRRQGMINPGTQDGHPGYCGIEPDAEAAAACCRFKRSSTATETICKAS